MTNTMNVNSLKKAINTNSMAEIGARALTASHRMNKLGQEDKNRGLLSAADALVSSKKRLTDANLKDVEKARKNGMKASLIDRLTLTPERIDAMAEGIRQVAALEDPIGEMLWMKVRPNGLMIGQKRVPIGVIGIIYEARPNVTVDAFALCFKTGNAVILRGGSDAVDSNREIGNVIRESLLKEKLPEDSIILVEDTSHEAVQEMMRLNQYIDVLIPRGGAGLIRSVIENSTVPAIETGTGNCHIYVDEFADIDMAVPIIVNAKTQRLGVCNACESLVVHSAAAAEAVPRICDALTEKNVEIRGDVRAQSLDRRIVPASEEDWGTEYLDAIISLKIVDSIDEAIDHINKYNTKHSESIITKDYSNALRFQNEIDAAAVYANASTRFTDGYEFGFGAEIGISTQKLHARGPMGLLALTTTKYVINGNGQIRK